jgi:hypothetical protein
MGLPLCDRCYSNDKVSEVRDFMGIRIRMGQFVKVYWCARCKHKFRQPTNEKGPIYYDNGKAYLEIEGKLFRWNRVRDMDAKALKVGA